MKRTLPKIQTKVTQDLNQQPKKEVKVHIFDSYNTLANVRGGKKKTLRRQILRETLKEKENEGYSKSSSRSSR